MENKQCFELNRTDPECCCGANEIKISKHSLQFINIYFLYVIIGCGQNFLLPEEKGRYPVRFNGEEVAAGLKIEWPV